jgi:hypothetical protein
MTGESPPQFKPFTVWLQEQRGGGLHGELSEKLAELSRAVLDNEKAGTLTLTIKVSPSKMDGAVQVEDKIAVKTPEGDRGAAIFFPDALGNLSRRDPRQPELPLRDLKEASSQ